MILPQLKVLGKCPVKLGQFFMTLEEDLLNYSLYFKNLPQQTALMEEGGIEFYSVSYFSSMANFSLIALTHCTHFFCNRPQLVYLCGAIRTYYTVDSL